MWEYGRTSGFKEQGNDGCFIRATYCGEGGALWFDCSLVITNAAQRPGWIFPCSCALNIAAWQVEPDEGCPHVGETKFNCFWHCYQSFRICLYVCIILMKLYYDDMKVSTLVPAGKKGLNLGFMCPLASRLSRYNIPSNTNETTIATNVSQWFVDQRQYSHHN